MIIQNTFYLNRIEFLLRAFIENEKERKAVFKGVYSYLLNRCRKCNDFEPLTFVEC